VGWRRRQADQERVEVIQDLLLSQALSVCLLLRRQMLSIDRWHSSTMMKSKVWIGTFAL
jgi:hypothetical protein